MGQTRDFFRSDFRTLKLLARTNPGLFQIRFQHILVPFVANLTHFLTKSGYHGLEELTWVVKLTNLLYLVNRYIHSNFTGDGAIGYSVRLGLFGGKPNIKNRFSAMKRFPYPRTQNLPFVKITLKTIIFMCCSFIWYPSTCRGHSVKIICLLF